MTAQEIRELDTEALLAKVEEYKKELFGLRFQQATGQLENTARIRHGSPCRAAPRSPSTQEIKISWSAAVPAQAKQGSLSSPTCSSAIPPMWLRTPRAPS